MTRSKKESAYLRQQANEARASFSLPDIKLPGPFPGQISNILMDDIDAVRARFENMAKANGNDLQKDTLRLQKMMKAKKSEMLEHIQNIR